MEAVVRSQQRPLQAKSPNANAGPLRPTRPRSAPTRSVPLHRPKPVSPPPAAPDGFVVAAKPSRPASAARLKHLAKHKTLHVDAVLPSINSRPCSRERLFSLSRPKKTPPEAGPLESAQRSTRPATAARLDALSRPIVRQTHEVIVHTPMEKPKMRAVGKREEVQGATAMDSRVEGARVFTLNLSNVEEPTDGGKGKPATPANTSAVQEPSQVSSAEPAVDNTAEAVAEPAAEPVAQAAEPAAEPTAQAAEPTPEPVTEMADPSAETASEAASEPTTEPATVSATESAAEPAPEPEPVADPEPVAETEPPVEAEAEPKLEPTLAAEATESGPRPELEAVETREVVAPTSAEQSADSQEVSPAEANTQKQEESALEGSVENAWATASTS